MNFTPEQLKPLENISLIKLKARLLAAAEKESDGGDETPAKIPRLDEEVSSTVEQPQVEFGSLDGLVIACRQPGPLAKELLKLLSPSSSFVIFSPHLEVSISIKSAAELYV